MNCTEARLAIAAEPAASSAELEEHLRSCAACQQFRREVRALEADIARALALGPPLPRSAARATPGASPAHAAGPLASASAAAPLARVIPLPQANRKTRRAPAWRPWAMAASLVLAVALGTALWLGRPADTLAHDVVVHVRGEPDSWLAKQQVSVAGIDHALRANGVELGILPARITYAHSCFFRGHYIPHLVVQTTSGPVTVLILKHEQTRGTQRFSEHGLSGIIVPAAQSGSIAVLAQDRAGTAAAAVAPAAAQMQRETQWLDSSVGQ
ncbi:MAG: DUF3379 family protein [Proteobacteria bacterium]|nr:DUF3379 family protein [Pseudomonadota bacterium]